KLGAERHMEAAAGIAISQQRLEPLRFPVAASADPQPTRQPFVFCTTTQRHHRSLARALQLLHAEPLEAVAIEARARDDQVTYERQRLFIPKRAPNLLIPSRRPRSISRADGQLP